MSKEQSEGVLASLGVQSDNKKTLIKMKVPLAGVRLELGVIQHGSDATAGISQ